MVSLLEKWQLLQKMIADPELSAASLRVAARLLDFLNGQTGQCDPSAGTLADRLGMDRRTVMRATAQLERLGYLRRQRRCNAATGNHRSSAFTFDFPQADGLENESGGSGEMTTSGEIAPSGELASMGSGEIAMGVVAKSPPKTMNKKPIDISRDLDVLDGPRASANGSAATATSASDRKANKRTCTEAASPEGWETFRARYPRRPAARWSDARKHFDKLLRSGTKPNAILTGCEAYAAHVARRGTAPEFVEDPSNWLSRRRFEDDFGEPAISAAAPTETNAANWGVLLKRFHETGGIDGGGYWPAALGPAPGTRGCRVPPQLLAQLRKEAA